jgi:hypothetical protein
MLEPNRNSDENTILTTLIICHCINYNSFLLSLLVNPPLVLISYYFQLVREADLWSDPYTGIALST